MNEESLIALLFFLQHDSHVVCLLIIRIIFKISKVTVCPKYHLVLSVYHHTQHILSTTKWSDDTLNGAII